MHTERQIRQRLAYLAELTASLSAVNNPAALVNLLAVPEDQALAKKAERLADFASQTRTLAWVLKEV